MIYCVVPQELEEELFEKLQAYYADDPNVEVIVDRRKAERRAPGPSTGGHQREIRDRRRRRLPGDFPEVETPSST
jgi:hypothetical protein